MTQQDFNSQIVALANRIASVWEYSYTRQGFKYDPRNPERFLSTEERTLVRRLQGDMEQLATHFDSTNK